MTLIDYSILSVLGGFCQHRDGVKSRFCELIGAFFAEKFRLSPKTKAKAPNRGFCCEVIPLYRMNLVLRIEMLAINAIFFVAAAFKELHGDLTELRVGQHILFLLVPLADFGAHLLKLWLQ